MPSFRLEFAGGPALAHYTRRMLGRIDLDAALPACGTPASPAEQWAADRWLANAHNEHHSAGVMAQLAQLVCAAQAPIDLAAMVCGFAGQELVHAELCARLALSLSATPRLHADNATALSFAPGLTARQCADEAVLRLCAISETISFTLLGAMKRHATDKRAQLVVARLLKDEALHGRAGWMYLEWTTQDMASSEKRRLAQVAAASLDGYGKTPAGVDAADASHLGILNFTQEAAAVNEGCTQVRKRLAQLW